MSHLLILQHVSTCLKNIFLFSGGQQRGYENIDNKVPNPTNNVETATPHYTSPPSMT